MILLKLHIRQATLGDLEAIKVLADTHRAELGFVLRPALATDIERGWILVAELPEQGVIGFVHYRNRLDSQTTLYEICVRADCRRCGVGSALVKRLSEEASALGKTHIRLKAPIELPANCFYQTTGFILTDTEPGKHRLLNVWTYPLSYREPGA